GDAVFLQVLRRVRLVHAVVEPQAPVRRKVVTGLGPRAPALDSALLTRSTCVGSSPLRDVAKLLSEVVAEIVVAVHREFPGRDVVAGLNAPAVQRSEERRVGKGW